MKGNWKHAKREAQNTLQIPQKTPKKNGETRKRKSGELSQHLIVIIGVALAEDVGRVPPLPKHHVPERHPIHRRRREGPVVAPALGPPAPLRGAFPPPFAPARRHPTTIARGPLWFLRDGHGRRLWGKETTGDWRGKARVGRRIGDGETWRTSFFVLFISWPPGHGSEGGRFGRGHGGRGAAAKSQPSVRGQGHWFSNFEAVGGRRRVEGNWE